MGLHKEGTATILIFSIVALVVGYFSRYGGNIGWTAFLVIFGILLILILQFFRNPKRNIPAKDENKIYAPADGKVVVIEKATESEYFKDERLQISIFMSPINVHVNRCATSGEVMYAKYHAGKYLVAWHPKSSTENERTTTVLQNEHGPVLYRQIAGALARRIVNYLKKGDQVQQGQEMGFIKFGSRMDIFLPLDAKVHVEMNQMVKGNLDVIASFK